MSFEATIEHIWMSPEQLPPTLKHLFKAGACTVWANEEYTGAIPATNHQTEQLADLFESCAVALDDDFTGARGDYFKMRDALCAPLGHIVLAKVFKQELDKAKQREEAAAVDKRCLLASAARPRGSELN